MTAKPVHLQALPTLNDPMVSYGVSTAVRETYDHLDAYEDKPAAQDLCWGTVHAAFSILGRTNRGMSPRYGHSASAFAAIERRRDKESGSGVSEYRFAAFYFACFDEHRRLYPGEYSGPGAFQAFRVDYRSELAYATAHGMSVASFIAGFVR